ncbi:MULTISPECIES: YbdD/YjiX family protein [unclassified Agrococcus]|uniref:YbdD/YjiX family protein n=1 Tax=unclassified Agrococcus TaxID=2615065 RepID=UPI003611C6B3
MPELAGSAARALGRAWRATAWYARGLTGESRYESYLEHELAAHPEREPLDRRAFWRDYHRWQDSNPQGRCC